MGISRRGFVVRLARFGAASIAVPALAGCAAPPIARETPRLRRIGYLSGNARASVELLSAPFRQQLRELGYVEGRDIALDFRVADNAVDRLPALAAELVSIPVDVLVAEAAPAQLAARDATRTIPIVLVLATDPVGQGLIATLARPSGNITGVTTSSEAVSGKRIELLKEMVPGLRRVGVIWNANNAAMLRLVQETERAGRALGLETVVFGIREPDELDAAVATIAAQHLDGFVMLPGLSIIRDFHQVPELAAKHRLPQAYSDIEIAKAGGLMHLGANFAAMHRRAAGLVDKILKGARPADLPVEQPTEFDLVVNLAMAERLGLSVPDSILRRATELVR